MSKLIAYAIVGIYNFLTPLRKGLLLTFFGFAGKCKHQPTCSQYFLLQVQQYGWRGFFSGLKRLLSCY